MTGTGEFSMSLDDRAHRPLEPAGRVEQDHQGRGAVGLRALDRGGDEAHGDGADDAVDLEGRDRLRPGRRDQRERQREAGQDTAGDRPTPPTASHWSGCIIARHGTPDAAARPTTARSLRAGPATDPLYRAYHDREWGVPLHDDRRLFELLCLEGAQAGLVLDHDPPEARGTTGAPSTASIPRKVAAYGAAKIRTLLADPGIVRNRLKVEGAVQNARAFLALRAELGQLRRLRLAASSAASRGRTPGSG